MVNAIDSKQKRDGVIYKKCREVVQEIYSTIISIIDEAKKKDVPIRNDADVLQATLASGSKSLADQIRELAKLKDEGLLTEDEFNQKKRDLLDIR